MLITTSVIVPTADDNLRLEWVLEGLCCQDRRDFEVVVVNDGGDESVQQLVERYVDRLALQYHYFGPKTNDWRAAAARNHGVKNSVGEWLILLDADTVPSPNMLSVHLDRSTYGRVTFAERLSVPLDKVTAFKAPLDYGYLMVNQVGDIRSPYPRQPLWNMCWSCHTCLPAALYCRLGGMDERYVNLGDEDIDFFWRCRMAGAEFWPVFGISPCFHLDHPPRGYLPPKPSGPAEVPEWAYKEPLIRNGGPIRRLCGYPEV